MLKYQLKVTGTKHRIVTAEFEDEKYAPLSSFILSEVRNFGQIITNKINSVINHKSEKEDFSGNIYSLVITPETTTLTDNFAEYNNTSTELTVCTEELLELIQCIMHHS